MEFRVLGSLEVVDRDGPVALGAPKQRALLAVLLLHRGEPVSSGRLIDEIWGEQPPASANKIVQGYVSSLRKLLGDGRLLTQGRGYMLRVEPGQTDVDRFEALVVEGRRALEDSDALTAGAVLREALTVWRGPALTDFAYQPFAQAEIARLEESRVAALEDRIDADLASGEHARLVGELEALVREYPLRERLRGQLMLALYRSGRQADALRAYQDGRSELLDGLGLEPGPELKALERAILAQDPGLDLPTGHTPRPSPATDRNRVRGAALIAAAGALLLAAIVAVAVKLAGSSTTTVRVAPNSLAAIDTASDRVTAAAPVGARPGAVVFGSGSLWVANLDDQNVSRIDPRTLRTVRNISVAAPPTGLAAAGGGVWVLESTLDPDAYPSTSSVLVGRIDPEFNTAGSTAPIGDVAPDASAIAGEGDSVWVAPTGGLLTRLNATTGAVTKRWDPNATPIGIAVSEGAVWLTDSEADNVVRVDPATGFVNPIPVGDGPTGITVGDGSVWVVDSLDDRLVRIDPGTQSVTQTVPVGRSPTAVAFGAGSVWVANGGDGTVTRINPANDRLEATIPVGGSPQAITIANGKAWVTIDAQTVTPAGRNGGTLRALSPLDVDAVDPALAYSALSQQIIYSTCAALLSYPDKAGPAGALLTPEVAQSLPTRSPDGRTYTFKIRAGFRFSPPSNQAVTAQTFKYTIERTLKPQMQSGFAADLADIVGARAYMAGKAAHIAGVTAHGNTLTVRLIAPAPDFVSRIAETGFCAVPTNAPPNANGVQPVSSAGPYYVASYTPKQAVVLLRNPNYHGSRPHHFARIQLTVGVSDQRAVAEIEAGTADYISLGLGSSASSELTKLASDIAARYGPGSRAAARGSQQYFINRTPTQLDAFILNTHRPLFSDVRMRRAVNYAINREQLAKFGDEYNPLPARPTSHYVPPGVPAFRDVSVYPTTPDLATARTLERGRGGTAVLDTCNASPCPEQAQIVKNNLAAIGLQVQINKLSSTKLSEVEAQTNPPFDLAPIGWRPDYLDPAGVLNPLLADASWAPPFIDPTYQRRLATADKLSGPARYLNYGTLDLDLARNAAPLVAYDNLSSRDFFSARIGCQTAGVYGIDLAALCLRRGER
jgi:YVTN family beta-propeller protein